MGKQHKNKKHHSYKSEVGKVAENILNRDFNASKPYVKITTDVTQFKVGEEKIYLATILDLYNGEIISYSISLSPNLEQQREMLQRSFDVMPKEARPVFPTFGFTSPQSS